ncbi:2-oxo acid dehydrogenase subunit E2 [Pseudohoeflea suaedae]|uniref:Dihydrolipoamide acetyltransferase component of pyruvate dehydrogenase complex n=1 Tax=Pseudohoeflea suaedae TaxID=877384 RepID=A0A4R5PK27_9HYPH|nr:dihydrolipoamide acetyltransferase family protein [Pseudohoeflea suaedae]TDH35945.1 2-oxo acid dehydrogenase subunit E2 [Pseudohoeflea suaedae]
MARVTIKLPDVGEGIAEAELTEWAVKIGDEIQEDDVLGTVMTDKAAVEVPSSVSGKVVWLAGEPGDTLAIGSKFVEIETSAETAAAAEERMAGDESDGAPDESVEKPAGREDRVEKPEPEKAEKPEPARAEARPEKSTTPATPRTTPLATGERPLASPAIRQRARDAGIDLRLVAGSGPAGRITHDDLDAWIAQPQTAGFGSGRLVVPRADEDVKVIGMRKRIAEKMSISASRIPHITIVEEVDVTDLEALREKLNGQHAKERGKLTVLPFLIRAICKAVAEQPGLNATFDDEAGVIHQSGSVHVGIATQTPNGLTVPVVRHAEAMSLWDAATEVARLADAARSGKARREELSGSTISITSLGALGAIATTPIINHPEVAIVGVNKMAMRPVWDGSEFVPRKIMNLSSSFDHRVIDGWDAAVFVRKLKDLIETPALLFIDE